MKRDVTVKENYEFRRMYSKGKSGVSSCLVVYFRPNKFGHNRLGVTVSAKLGHAVVRNRARRRLRETYRLNETRLKSGFDIVIVARSAAAEAPFELLQKDFLALCSQLSLLEEPEHA